MCLGGVACSPWPVFAHWPDGSAEAAAVGDVAPEFAWTEVPAQEDVDDVPGSVAEEALSLGHGTRTTSRFTGTGWDDSLLADFDTLAETGGGDDSGSSCHDRVDFPPVPEGDWTGDVDWRRVEVTEAGTLCSVFEARDDGVRADVLLYTLDKCDYPFNAVLSDGSPLGWRVDEQVNAWSFPVEPTAAYEQIGVVAAGWAPVADDVAVYDWGIALVAAGESCPSLPGTP